MPASETIALEVLSAEINRHGQLDNEFKRLFHGRGQCFPSCTDLLIDWIPPVALVQLYGFREEEWLRALSDLLQKQLAELKGILLQERFLPGTRFRLLWGRIPQPLDAWEQNLRYRLRLGEAQNIGFFPDMARGRQLVRQRCAGKKVLNLFAYSCSFSVTALAGGADQVVNLDMNRGALQLGRQNHQLNGLDLRRCSFLPLELFRSFGRLRRLGPFDFVICDPPAAQGKNFQALRDWSRIFRRIPELLDRNGEFLVCLNGPGKNCGAILASVRQFLPQTRLLQVLTPGADFPESDPHRGSLVYHFSGY